MSAIGVFQVTGATYIEKKKVLPTRKFISLFSLCYPQCVQYIWLVDVNDIWMIVYG